MNVLNWLFFESTLALGILIGLGLFFLIVYWRRTLRLRPLLIGMGISIVLLIVQSLVVTPRERAEAVLDPIVADLSRDRTNLLASALTADFRADEMDRVKFLEFVQTMLRRVDIHAARSSDFAIENHAGDRFDAIASYTANVTVSGSGQGYVPSTWRFAFVRIGDRWFISRIQPVRILNSPMRDWKQVGELR